MTTTPTTPTTPITLTLPDERIDWRTKGFWQPGPAISFEEFAAAGHSLFGGAFTWPIMVARRKAIEHNISALADFCARHDLGFAPHGKTTMAPSLFGAQMRAGAWAITVATANQVLACRAFGVPRVLLANQLLDPAPLGWIAEEVERGWEFLCFVDSVEGVEAIASAVARVPGARPIRVLAELGHMGGRAGCRTVTQLVEVARAAVAAPRIELAGVAGYEGLHAEPADADEYVAELRAATVELAGKGLLPESVIVSAGGSIHFDVVADRLAGAWLPGHDIRTILRSGAYISHDDGLYRQRTPFARRPEEGALRAALEIWAQVTSTPEEALAIAGLGKREAPYDEGLPVPLRVRGRDGTVREATGMRVIHLKDHHTYVELTDGARVEPGELICFGISHPCTAFDKWQVIPVVEDDYTVSDLIRTYF